MVNSLTIRTTAPGAQQTATDLNNVKTSAQGAGTSLKTSFSGLSSIDNSMGSVNSKLLEMSRNSRLLNRETRGINTFATALDTIAGTNFSGTIQDIKTVAEVADPLKQIGQDVINKIKSLLPGAAAAGASVGAAEGEAEAEAATGPGAVSKFLAKFGIGTGEKVAAAAAAGELEGTAEGEAEGEAAAAAAKGPAAVGAATGAGGILGAAMGVGMMGAIGVAVLELPAILDHLTGQDTTSKFANAGKYAADAFAGSYSPTIKAQYAQIVQDTFNAGGQTEAAGKAGVAQANAWLAQFAPAVVNGTATVAVNAFTGFNEAAKPAAMAAGTDLGVVTAQATIDAAAQALNNANMDAAVAKFADHVGGPLKGSLILKGAEAGAASGNAVAGGLASQAKTVDNSAMAIGNSIVEGLASTKKDVATTMSDLMYAIKHPLELEKEDAQIQAALTSKKLQEGLNSSNPLIKKQAEQTQQKLLDLWQSLNDSAYTDGSKASDSLQTSLSSNYARIKHDASAFVGDMNGIFQNLQTHYTIKVDSSGNAHGGNPGHIPGFASGGRYAANRPRIVGENGPELDVPDHSGVIMPSTGAGSSGSGPMNIAVTVNLSTRSVAAAQQHYATVQAGGPAFR
jgi:hypothetical protein